ncbi:MAG: class I SAM-dependent methyltransferase [Planctomycetales bacterium]|nr:class I SAM-dependent methyltransferase [Planctomycetales bacterium]
MNRNSYDLAVERIDQWQNPPIAVSPCPVCRVETAQPTFVIEGLSSRLVTCGQCGLGRLDPMPSAEEIRGFYPDDVYGVTGEKFESFVESLVRWVASRQAQFLSRGLQSGARVLDVGCGRGVLLRSMADCGLEVHGTDISPAAVQGVDSRAAIRIVPCLADAAYPTGFFDQVILWHVLEHLPDPRETLVEIERVLKPGGRVVVAVPNFSSLQSRWAGPAWFHLDLPRHLFHFPLESLQFLLTDCGFDVLSAHHFSLRQNPFGWIQSALNRVRWLPRNGLYVLLHRRPDSDSLPFDRRTRLCLRIAYIFGAPLAVLLSVFEAVFRSGATVHVVAKSRRLVS